MKANSKLSSLGGGGGKSFAQQPLENKQVKFYCASKHWFHRFKERLLWLAAFTCYEFRNLCIKIQFQQLYVTG